MKKHLFLRSFLFVLLVNFTLFFCQGQNSTNKTLEKAHLKIISHFQKKSIPFDWNLHSFKKIIKDGKVGVTFNSHYEYEILKPEFRNIPGQSLNWLFLANEYGTEKARIFNLAGVEVKDYNCRYLKRILNEECLKDNDTINWHDSFHYRKDFKLSYVCANYIITDMDYKMGIIDSEGELLLPFEHYKIDYAGGNFYITYADASSTKFQIFDINSKKVILDGDDIKVFFFLNKEKNYSIHQSLVYDREVYFAVKNNDYWKLLNSKLEELYPKSFIDVYQVDNHFIIKTDSGYSIITKEGQLLVQNIPNYITNVLFEKGNLAFCSVHYVDGVGKSTLYSDKNEVLLKWNNGTLYTDKSLIGFNFSYIKGKFPERKIIGFLSETDDGIISKIIYDNFEIESIEK
jgi:hypothetical protein